MAMSRSYLAKKIHEIEVILQRLSEDLPAEISDRPDGASAPHLHARQVSAEVERADRRQVTSAESYAAEERASLTAAIGRAPLTRAESSQRRHCRRKLDWLQRITSGTIKPLLPTLL